MVAGAYNSLAVTSNGPVVAWGDNSQGQASVPPDLAGAVAVAGGGSHSLALKADGTVAAWGNNLDGQCNISPAVSNVIAVAAGKSHSLLLLGNPYTLPKILRPIWQENQFQILVLTLPGKYYALEYKNSLSLTNWSSGPAVRGNGGLQFLTDPSATAPSRFYRVRQSS